MLQALCDLLLQCRLAIVDDISRLLRSEGAVFLTAYAALCYLRIWFELCSGFCVRQLYPI